MDDRDVASYANQKTIGILGGMGSFATCELFRRIVAHYQAEKEWYRPRILIDNRCTMPSRVRAIIYGEGEDELVRQMTESVEWLVNGGAKRVLIGCMTAHYFLPRLPQQDKILNLLELTAEYVRGTVPAGSEICVLCTEGSRETGIWEKVLRDYRVRYEEDAKIRDFIELVKQNRVASEDRQHFSEMMLRCGADYIVLGCTELPILMTSGDKRSIRKTVQVIDPINVLLENL